MLHLYNYLTRTKELFKPLKNRQVGLYTCGPTVYDRIHIGNLRTYIFEDVLKKTLELNNYKVKHIMNITDVEDKIIKKMQAENKTLQEVTQPYIDLFFTDIKKLNISPANKYPQAIKYIKQIIKMVSKLLKKGFAYQSEDGSIYFDISKFEKYGKLSGLDKKNLKHGARVDSDEYDKKNAGDFVLWKTTKKDELSWEAPFGKGRPGWHIECSAMSIKELGKTFDIHAGAVDLIFPHHENEIAQSEAVTGKEFAKYWIEGEHLLVENKKMSKSLGNFYTLEDIEKKGFDPLAFRYLTLNTHYRTKLNFTWESLENAKNGLKKLREQVQELGNKKGKPYREYTELFKEKMNDDLNTPQALAIVQKLLKKNIPNEDKLATTLEFDKVLGLDLNKKVEIPEDIKRLAKEREQARQEKNYEKSDQLREVLEKKGWNVKDTEQGPTLTQN
ncbi:cysteine--tRNA ligase [Patescibacteria group bacterium]